MFSVSYFDISVEAPRVTFWSFHWRVADFPAAWKEDPWWQGGRLQRPWNHGFQPQLQVCTKDLLHTKDVLWLGWREFGFAGSQQLFDFITGFQVWVRSTVLQDQRLSSGGSEEQSIPVWTSCIRCSQVIISVSLWSERWETAGWPPAGSLN